MARRKPALRRTSSAKVRSAVLLGPRLGAELRVSKKGALLACLRQAGRKPGVLRIGVDGGALFGQKLGLGLDVTIGDWDSVNPAGRPPRAVATEAITLPRDKNDSDLRAALKVAVKRGAREIICAGFSGGRPDQALGVLLDLAATAAGEFGQVGAVTLHGPDWIASFLSGKINSWSAKLPVGTTVSVFSLNGPATGVTLNGFRFPLTQARLQPGSVGLSNQSAKAHVKITLTIGRLVVFRLAK